MPRSLRTRAAYDAMGTPRFNLVPIPLAFVPYFLFEKDILHLLRGIGVAGVLTGGSVHLRLQAPHRYPCGPVAGLKA